MCFQVHFRLEDICLVCLTFGVHAHKVLFGKVFLQFLVVEVVLWVSTSVSSIADVTSFMFLPTVGVEFVVSIEPLFAKAAFGMAFESRLVDSTWIIVSELLMFSKLTKGEQLMLVCENLLVSGAEVAHHLSVFASDMAVQIWPSEAGHIAVFVRAVIPQ
jgi:hypothetical protein